MAMRLGLFGSRHMEGSLAASPTIFCPEPFTLTWKLVPKGAEMIISGECSPVPATGGSGSASSASGGGGGSASADGGRVRRTRMGVLRAQALKAQFRNLKRPFKWGFFFKILRFFHAGPLLEPFEIRRWTGWSRGAARTFHRLNRAGHCPAMRFDVPVGERKIDG